MTVVTSSPVGTAGVSAGAIAELLGQPPPTPEQSAIIEADLESALVVAGAGSGKTETMTSRVVWLVANGLAAPEEILGLTFTRKAAAELSTRVAARLRQLARAGLWRPSEDLQPGATVTTYHAYAGRLVAEHGMRLGLEPHPRLLSEGAAWQIAHDVVAAYDGPMDHVDYAESTVIAAVMAIAGESAEHLVELDDIDAYLSSFADTIEALPAAPGRGGGMTQAVGELVRLARARRQLLPIVREYASRKRHLDALDFADQMAFAAHLSRRFPQIAAAERDRWSVVLLDEFQDTSEAQLVLLQSLFAAGDRAVPVLAVGDPNQSIYGWRGASSTTLSRFPQEFGSRDVPTPVLPLSTSWRNDEAILDVANQVAAPLRKESSVRLERLVARPAAAAGEVVAARFPDHLTEADAVARWIADRWWMGPEDRRAGGRPRPVTGATAAVLCRRRAQFPQLVAALTAQGLPVEVVGLGGLLTTPEVSDVVSTLAVIADLGRGDALMRLLTGPRLNLGAADIDALAAWASRPRPGDEPCTLVEALEDLPAPGWIGPEGESLSPTAYGRLSWLGSAITRLRSLTGLPLPELVAEVEHVMGIDVDLRSRPQGVARVHLDAFVDVASDFESGAEVGTLPAFLAWLDAAAEQERGLDLPEVAITTNAVQVLTVHAAKGLEWDVVAVPGLVDGIFPSTDKTRSTWRDGEWRTSPPSTKGWCRGLDSLPYDLRGDRDGLPHFRWRSCADLKELKVEFERFTAEGGEHLVVEDRRLAYVAFTRAKRALLLSSSVWADGTTPRVTSPFLTEVRDHPVVRQGPWAPMPDGDADVVDNPLAAEAEHVLWPAPATTTDRGASPTVEDVGAAVRTRLDEASEPLGTTEFESATRRRILQRNPIVSALLQERAERARGVTSVALPAHLSTTTLMGILDDPARAADDVRRPMPRPPAPEARAGTAFHAWVEEHYQRAAIVDVDDLPGAADHEAMATSLEVMKEHFLSSPWADRTPLAVEVDVEHVVAGIALRGRVDAVFDDGPGRLVVVDWKTGQPPVGRQQRVRSVQLAAYRAAIARLHELPPEAVTAAFYYAASGETVFPPLPTEADLTDYLAGVLSGEALGPSSDDPESVAVSLDTTAGAASPSGSTWPSGSPSPSRSPSTLRSTSPSGSL